jgi:hypothetical protein
MYSASAQAEYLATAVAAKQATWLRQLLGGSFAAQPSSTLQKKFEAIKA